MAKAKSMRSSLTAREAFWLGHLREVERRGIGSKAYAEARGLSIHALYQARKRLVSLGAWPERRAAAAPVFAPVRVVETPASGAACRLRLADGHAIEWSVAPTAETLAALLDRASVPR